jgi:hypothetical protein
MYFVLLISIILNIVCIGMLFKAQKELKIMYEQKLNIN